MDKATICQLLGLPADTPDDQVLAKLKEKLAQPAPAATPTTTTGDTEHATKFAALEQTTVKLTEQVNALSAENAALKTAQRTSEVKAFCDEMIKVGKLTPAAREDIEKLGMANGVQAIQFVTKFRESVPMGEIGVAGTTAAEPREEVVKRVNAKAAELVKSGLSFADAHAAVRAEMGTAYTKLFEEV